MERQDPISSARTGHTVTVWPPCLALQLCPGGKRSSLLGEMEPGSLSGASRAAQPLGEEEGAGGKYDVHVPERPPGDVASGCLVFPKVTFLRLCFHLR